MSINLMPTLSQSTVHFLVLLVAIILSSFLVNSLPLSARNSRPRQQCRLDDESAYSVALRAYLSPTVVEATALERFKYFKPTSFSSSSQTGSSISYSVLFQIKRIFKYENQLVDDLLDNDDDTDSNDSSTGGSGERSSNQTYFYISSQNDYVDSTSSSNINLNSFFLVENFTPTIIHLADDNAVASCLSANIQMNKNYYLFIDAQDLSVKLSERRVFTYPIRVNSITKFKRMREKRAVARDDNERYSPSKLALFVKMPIFNLTAKPLLADNHFLEQTLEKVLCSGCGNPAPTVYWKRHTVGNVHEYLSEDFKFSIYYASEGTSILVINQVQVDDEGYYYCMARDYVNGGDNDDDEVIVQDRVKLLVRRRPLQAQSPTNKLVKKMWNRTADSYSASSRRKYYQQQQRYRNQAHSTPLSSSSSKSRQKLIEESLMRSQPQTTMSISAFIKYLTTKQPSSQPLTLPPFSSPSSSLPLSQPPIIEHKRVDLSDNENIVVAATTTAKREMVVKAINERAYVRCQQADNTCLNGGACYITNPNLHSDIYTYNQIKIKFCICEQYYEGLNCETSLLKTIVYNREEIPKDLRELWKSLGVSGK